MTGQTATQNIIVVLLSNAFRFYIALKQVISETSSQPTSSQYRRNEVRHSKNKPQKYYNTNKQKAGVVAF